MDIEQYVELDVKVTIEHRKRSIFVNEVYINHLEDTVEVFHLDYSEDKRNERSIVK